MKNFLGPEFAAQIESVKRLNKIVSTDSTESVPDSKRMLLFLGLFIAGILILAGRLFTINILQGSHFRNLALSNKTRESKITAPRGIIYDRNRIPLVRNVPAYTASNDKTTTLEEITREYIYPELAAHVLGFTGQVSQTELADLNKLGQKNLNSIYQPGITIGKTGVEKSFDLYLRGIDGKELAEVDAVGKRVRTLGRLEPVAGQNITLNLDINLTQVAAAAMQGRKGAVLASVPSSGDILLLYSSPSFDPNRFIADQNVAEILARPDQPMFNRVVGGQYPPGSTFKILLALAGLETGKISAEYRVEDTGVLTVGKFSFANWYFTQYGKREAVMDIVSALKRSNDIFFYKAGEAIGINNLAQWIEKAGVLTKFGIDIEGEAAGIMPSPDWLKKEKGQEWYLGNTYHVAIGQGDLLATPLQVNAWTNLIASGGKLCRPLIARSKNKELGIKNEDCKDLGIKKENIDLVREGMRQACQPGGTGWPLFEFRIKNQELRIDGIDFFETKVATGSAENWVRIPVACKTGTAEYGNPKGNTHAWFTAFAPINNPQISVTVLVEEGGEGSSVAAPIAKKILEEWFENEPL